MSIPQELIDALRKSPQFDPAFEHKDFKEKKELWKLYIDLMELDAIKLRRLVEKHSDCEEDGKYKLRQKLAAAFNLVPTLVNMLRGYLFSEEPSIDAKGDPHLEAFLADCDGTGRGYIDYVRQKILPLCAVQGVVDVLIQAPRVIGEIRSQKDLQDANIAPTLFPITLLKRINWSAKTSGDYNWVCFEDAGNENPDPLLRNIVTPVSYITITAENSDVAANPQGQTGFWIRSWLPIASGNTPNNPSAGTGTILPPTTETDAISSGRYLHEADWTPTSRAPVATLYWQESNDPDNRHMGVSKIAVIAVLTKLIIQILSWTTEDVLANLALLALPTEGGKQPKNEDGTPAIQNVNVFSTLCYDKLSKHPPGYLQGQVDHSKFKLDLVEKIVEEILRIAHMIGVSGNKSGQAGGEKSGFHAVVNRTELIQELKDTAGSLDRFTLEVLALVKSWATGEDWTRERLMREIGPTIDFFKGPWTTESVADVLEEAEAAIELFGEVSPSVVEAAFKKAARAYLYAADPAMPKAMEEIEENTAKFLASQSAQSLLGQAAAIAEGKVTATINETTTQDGPSVDADASAPPAATPKTAGSAKSAVTAAAE